MNGERCRLILIANPLTASQEQLKAVAETGLAACCLIYESGTQPQEFQTYVNEAAKVFQSFDTPILVAENSQAMGRSGADGIYLEKNRGNLGEMVEQHSPDRMVGFGNFKKRHDILEAGEAGVDFLLMGKLGGDTRADPHPRNIQMAEWAAEIIDIPIVVLAGSSYESVVACAKTGADFVALEQGIFSAEVTPADALIRAEQLLEQHAPRFEEVGA